MLQRAFVALLLLALASAAAHAQTFTLPQIGLQNSGTCPQLAVQDRATKAMVPIGCVLPSGQGFSLTPKRFVMDGLSPLDKDLAGIKNPTAVRFGAGNQISFCPAKSCVRGPAGDIVDPAYFDHQRASLLVSGQTQIDGQAQEQSLAVTTTINKGYIKKYAANTAYALGDNVEVGGGFGGAVYRVTQAGTTGASSAPPSGRPAQGASFTYTDGSVKFLWINDSAITAKVGAYFETEIYDGAGAAWGFANNVGIMAGANRTGQATFAFENDFTNNSGFDCQLGTPCDAIRVGVGGVNKSTSGINIDTNNGVAGAPQNFSLLWGLRFSGPKLASEALIALDASGQYGIAANQLGLGGESFTGALIYDNSASPSSLRVTGPKTTAAVEDVSNSPAGILIGGTKTLSGIRESSTAPTGINLVGTYSGSQIQGNGWSIAPNGSLTVPRIRETSPRTIPTSTTACQQGERAYDATYEYRCVDTNTWKRAALMTW